MTCSMGHHYQPKCHRPPTEAAANGCRSNHSSSRCVKCCNSSDGQGTIAFHMSEGPSSQISPIHRKNKPHEEVVAESGCAGNNWSRWISRNRVYTTSVMINLYFNTPLKKRYIVSPYMKIEIIFRTCKY